MLTARLPEKLRINGDAIAKLFKPKTPPMIGVDISSSSVKLVELADAGKGRYRLERYAIEPMPKDAVVDGNVMNLEAVGETMRRGWKRMGTRIKNVAMALPSAQVITKKIVVPAGLREEDLEVQVETEANQYIPFALEEVNLDFQIIGPSPTNAEEVEVLIAASRKEKVEDRVACAEVGGLKAVVMDIDSFAAQNAFEIVQADLPDGGKDLVIALVDIGASLMIINVMRNNTSVYMREQPFGGNQLTQEIQRHYNLSPEEAEAAKRSGGLPETYENEVVQPFMETLGSEVTRALQFFFTSTQFSNVDHIYLSGGTATLPGLDAVVSKRANATTHIVNPFAAMDVAAKIKGQQLDQDGPALVVACGLALRRFDQ